MEVSGEIYLRIQSWKGVVLLLFFIALHSTLFAQSSLVTGYVYSQVGHEPLTGATILAQSTEYATISDSTGYFKLELPPGLYNLEIRFVGYKTYVQQEIQTSGVRPLYLEIILDSQPTELTGVVIESAGFHKTDETPLSIRSFSYAEAFRIPGATLDLSKVIQSYPGVLPRSSFGYTIVFRGGSPTENGYYLDGVKIPSITHFSVQGASGGPNGLVNLDFVKNVDIYTAAFPVSRGNALSGVMEITERDGRTDKFGARVTLGATDYGATIEGPMGKNRVIYFLHVIHSVNIY
ncbi:MAG: TonB-dependent receptor [Bacteroidetes bacterium]|nr:TonB-dependent receptor [Bacteroidota bacterium]